MSGRATDTVRVCETVRDAWQGLRRIVPTDEKVAFVQALLDAGFPRIDVGSFVSPERVPAMADTGDVLDRLDARGHAVTFTGLIANERGLERLLAAGGGGARVVEVLFPFSLSETFQRRNTKLSREEALALIRDLTARAHAAGRTMYVTVSMAFGNREGDAFDPAEQAEWVGRLHASGVDRVGLADTCALATPALLARVFAALHGGHAVPGVHLHATPDTQDALVDAAVDAGVRDFDAALGGLGGCQFATGAETNVGTRALARRLRARGLRVELPEDGVLEALDARAKGLARV